MEKMEPAKTAKQKKNSSIHPNTMQKQRDTSEKPQPEFSSQDKDRLIQGLRTRQTELEIENENLRSACLQIESFYPNYQVLRESEERYRSLIESSPEAICVLRKGILIYLNQMGLQLLGAQRSEEVLGKKSLNHVRRDFRRQTLEWIRRIQDGTWMHPRELKILRLDGQEVDVEMIARPIFFDGMSAIQIMVKDITDRKDTELRLRLQATVLSQVNDAVAAVGRDRRIIFWNKGAERLYKVSAEEAVGRQREELYGYRWIAPGDERAALEAIASTGFPRGENIHVLRSGEEIYVESSVSVLTDWSDAPCGWLAVMRDVTERKRLEKALRDSERLYRLMFESNPHPMWINGTDTLEFLFVNDAAIRHYGYSREEFLSMTLKDIHPAEDPPVLLDNVKKIAAGLHDSGAWRHKKKDGTIIDVEIMSHTLQVDGKGARLVLAHDVTERNRSDQTVKEARDIALRERNRLETILQAIPSGLFVTDKSGLVSSLNNHALTLLGPSEAEFSNAILTNGLYKPDGTLFPVEELPNIRAFRTGEVIRDVEVIVDLPGRRRITMLLNAAPLRDETGSIAGSITAFNDITERKETEDALKRVRIELEMRVRERTAELAATVSALQLEIVERKRAAAERDKLVAAVESTAEAIVVTDKTGIIEYVNPAFGQITGYQRNEVIGKDLHILDSGQNDQDFFPRMRETIRMQGVWKGRLINKKKDGTLYHEDCTYSPVKDLSGNITNYISIKHDVTEKLRLESIAETVDTMNNIGYVFSGIRHEIGNPVSSLMIIMGLLKKKYDTSQKEAIREYIDQAIAQVERIEYLLASLKNFNMYENLQIRSFRVSSFLGKFIPLVATDLESKGIVLQREAGSEEYWIAADPRALQQALLNVVVNASDALAARPDPQIDLSMLKAGGMVRIRVADNGMGIPDDRKKDLFKPFYTTKSHGTGLGLVITRKLISRMKGFIEISSRQDEGTIVDIYVPEGTVEYST